MATIQKIEDLQIWQMAREICKSVYTITRYPDFAQDHRFVGQIRAAAGSIMDNIAEGFGREGNKEFMQFLWVAHGSAMEVKSQLFRAYDVTYISREEFEHLLNDITLLCVKITNFINTLRSSTLPGPKYTTPNKTKRASAH